MFTLVSLRSRTSTTTAAVVLGCLVTSARPASAGDGFAEVAAQVRAGDASAALALLDALPGAQASADDVRYLRARVLARLGRNDEALAALPRHLAALPEAAHLREQQHYQRTRLGDSNGHGELGPCLVTHGKQQAALLRCQLRQQSIGIG